MDWSHQMSFSITTLLLVPYISGINLENRNKNILSLRISWLQSCISCVLTWKHDLQPTECLILLIWDWINFAHMEAFAKKTVLLGLWWGLSCKDEKQLQRVNNKPVKCPKVPKKLADDCTNPTASWSGWLFSLSGGGSSFKERCNPPSYTLLAMQ